ncbi:MAG: signal peptidase I [Clostridiales bacterium]|nr:signal peptidase I [Acholeplasmataceae bacterium]NLT18642.1 signal peptidase I [Clostridiales bacterium]
MKTKYLMNINEEYLVRLMINQLERKGEIRTVLKGESMRPAINSKDKVTIRKVDIKSIVVGDIIAYKRNDARNITIHRVVNICDNYRIILKTKGDNNNNEDPYIVDESSFIGIVLRDPII